MCVMGLSYWSPGSVLVCCTSDKLYSSFTKHWVSSQRWKWSATKGAPCLHPQHKWWNGIKCLFNILAGMMIQLPQCLHPWTRNDLLRECSHRPELSSPAGFSIHSAYEQKQSCPGFSVFERLPDFSRSLRYSRSISRPCLLKLIINSSVAV